MRLCWWIGSDLRLTVQLVSSRITKLEFFWISSKDYRFEYRTIKKIFYPNNIRKQSVQPISRLSSETRFLDDVDLEIGQVCFLYLLSLFASKLIEPNYFTHYQRWLAFNPFFIVHDFFLQHIAVKFYREVYFMKYHFRVKLFSWFQFIFWSLETFFTKFSAFR